MEENKWIIVRKEKTSTKIKNYFKNIFFKMFNNKKKKNELILDTKKPREILIEYEGKIKR